MGGISTIITPPTVAPLRGISCPLSSKSNTQKLYIGAALRILLPVTFSVVSPMCANDTMIIDSWTTLKFNIHSFTVMECAKW